MKVVLPSPRTRITVDTLVPYHLPFCPFAIGISGFGATNSGVSNVEWVVSASEVNGIDCLAVSI